MLIKMSNIPLTTVTSVVTVTSHIPQLCENKVLKNQQVNQNIGKNLEWWGHFLANAGNLDCCNQLLNGISPAAVSGSSSL